jgi:hypothetical protein
MGRDSETQVQRTFGPELLRTLSVESIRRRAERGCAFELAIYEARKHLADIEATYARKAVR